MKSLPQYYVIKRDASNPLWEKYIKWINSQVNDYKFDGTAVYYGYDGNALKRLKGFNYDGDIKNFYNSPTLITLEQWDEAVNGFVLPEKWCVKITEENIKIIGEYYDRKGAGCYQSRSYIGRYYSSHNLAGGMPVMGDKPYASNFVLSFSSEEYPEITFAQFKKHVLKENDMKETSKEELLEKAKRLYKIGVKFKSPCDGGSIRIINPYGQNTTVEYIIDSEGVRCNNGMHIEDVEGNYACSNPLVYTKGEWAEIISQPQTTKDRTITAQQAQSIIDVVQKNCPWKDTLVNLWSQDICHKRDIKVPESLYKDLRRDATPLQHDLGDSIFGKDNKEFTATDLKDGEFIRTEPRGFIFVRRGEELISLEDGSHCGVYKNTVGKKVRIKNIEFEEVND